MDHPSSAIHHGTSCAENSDGKTANPQDTSTSRANDDNTHFKKALQPIYRLPTELHIEVASYLPAVPAVMPLALIYSSMATKALMPMYIPQTTDDQRQMLVAALIHHFPCRIFAHLLDEIVFSPYILYGEWIMSACSDTMFRPSDWNLEANLGMEGAGYGKYPLGVGVLNAAVGMGRIDILHLLFARIRNEITGASAVTRHHWKAGLLTRYPTSIHFACSYARYDILKFLLKWYAEHVPDATKPIMNGMCTSSASFEWPTSPFDHALLGDHHGRTEEDVLAVLNLLNPYPIINIDIFGNHGHTLLELTARGYFLRSDVLEMVLRRLPLHSADAYFVIWRFLRYPNCTGAHIRALLRAGVEFPADGYEGPISTGNAELMEWLRKHVRGFVPSAEAMWRYLHGLLLFCELPFPWPDHLDPLLEVMVRISICLHPSGFTGQTLCLAIMSASWLTGRWTRNGHSIPRRWIWDLVYAMIRAGADVQEPWNDTQRPISPGYAHRPNYARSRDEPRLVGYLGWTASEMLSERERVGTL